MATISIRAPSVSPGATKTRRRMRTRLPAAIALLPTALIVLVVYIGCMLWTVRLSFTSSTLLPKLDWVGVAQYSRLFANDRFVTSAENIFIFGVPVHLRLPHHRLPARRLHRPERAWRRDFPHHLSLPVLDVVRRHRRRLAMVPQSRPRPAEARARHGFRDLHLRLDREPERWRSTPLSSRASGTAPA